ncbi:heavy metal translocating P-type ATPase [Clostridium minihomine]|uniref:heavy metal translocating P-type ATPase n=1 Tax=Clostridium minihomine TaxID=2045012 RepID=UPI000C76126F|nr:cation-translocating P-type ATPase [Clostridium minihomine]
MAKKINDLFCGIPMTVISGVFLSFSLAFLLTGISVPVDPAWVTVVICGFPLLYLALTRLIFEKWVSSALLISIAMAASIAIGELFAAGEVAFIMAVGAMLEDKTVERAKKGLKQLIGLAPAQGRRLVPQPDGTFLAEMVPVTEIQQGEILRVLPGEAIPVDGCILSGNTSVDQSVLTGESLPVDKAEGDSVFCGTINRFGAIELTATKVGEDSSLQKLIRMVQDAENNKAPMQRIADQWATWLVPVALAIAVITYFITGNLTRAVTVLVVFCPCALALATPTSIMAAIGQATKHGIIIKSGEALENMGKVNCIAFDKTGTLTLGQLTVSDVQVYSGQLTPQELLQITASAESLSEHPLGQAVTRYALEQGIPLWEASSFQMLPGKGIRAVVQQRNLLCGSSSYLEQEGVSLGAKVQASLEQFRSQGKATILIAANGVCVGAVAFSDIMRPQAKDMVQKLHAMGTQVVLLTGDHRQTAEYFAKQAGIRQIHAQLLPEEKVERIRQLQQEGNRICMVGDGVNDAPALKTAQVGVALGSMGSDIAVEAADIALTGDDISKIPYLKKLSNSTVRTIQFNITLSMIINLVAVFFSVAGVLNPITGALVHNAGSVLVVLNAALLYDRKLER